MDEFGKALLIYKTYISHEHRLLCAPKLMMTSYQFHALNDDNDVGMLNRDDNGVVGGYGWLSLCV